MSIATDVRAYADLAMEQGKAAVNQAGNAVSTANKRLTADAGKPVLAALGAADLVARRLGKRAETLGKRVESLPELPAAAAGNLAKAQESGKALLDRAQEDALARLTELRERLDASLATARSLPSLPEATSGYLAQAREAYDKLTARGETRWVELRKDPRVNRLLGDLKETVEAAEAFGDRVGETVTDSARIVEGTPKPRKAPAAASKSTPARTGTARTSTARTSTARKATAAKSGTARKAPAKKA
ncbi:MAG: hypothetical protein JO144_01620 [Actinobacteria bacterium]|nr:hypothetical protein [Actinomycetota bacterium]